MMQVFAAKSETLKFKTQTEPLGVHLALTDRVDEMRVTWKSDVSCRTPEVRFHGIGMDGFATKQVAKAASSTFTVDDVSNPVSFPVKAFFDHTEQSCLVSCAAVVWGARKVRRLSRGKAYLFCREA
jgi:hypothetical protein